MASIGGIETIQVDNLTFGQGGAGKIAESASLRFNRTVRESKTGLTGDAGYSETYQPAKLTASVHNAGTIPLRTLEALTDCTVSVVCKNGKTFALRNGRQVGDLEVDLAAGSFSLEIEAPDVREF